MRLRAVLCSLVAMGAFGAMQACGGDDEAPDGGSGGTTGTGTNTGSGGSAGDASGGSASGVSASGGSASGGPTSGGSAGEGSGGTTTSATGGSAGMSGGGGEGGAPVDPEVARGEYLVNVVSVCSDCHSPRNPDGSPDPDNYLAGVECFADLDPADDEAGCLNSRNLTNHATGLRNRSDQEIKNMFLNGERPNGEALHPFMPYWSYGNMSDEDADAIVAFLRTVPGVDHEVPANQVDPPAEPAERVNLDLVPEPETDDPNYESAMRGRYLAAQAGPCLECHTPENPPGSAEPRDLSMAFAGGNGFPSALFGLPEGFPEMIFTANLTSHDTGLAGWSAEDIVGVLQDGVTPANPPVCPPMPSGPMGAFARLTDADALDIANYLLSLPPIDNEVAVCEFVAP